MTTKEKLLKLFETNRGVYFSGEDLAQRLSISRSAVWKAVKALQSSGYAIDAVTNKGYCLSAQTDILSVQGIQKYLQPQIADLELSVLPIVYSTNAFVREKANGGAKEGYMVLANEQTAGRGRLGRSFFSPRDTGIYMSLLLRPNKYSAEQALRITTMAAVAMYEAIDAVSGKKAEIKWVNDIYLQDKKVCGILTEGSFDLENGMLEYAVLGIGINVYEPEHGFPNELKSIAGAIFSTHQNDAKNHLVAEFLNHFFAYYSAPESSDYVEKYRSRSLVIGKQITLTDAKESKRAYVLGIDDSCRLLVKYADGTQGCCSSGEVSIQL